VEGSNTDSALGMSNWDNAWQRPANLDISVAGMALQRPANPIGSTGDRRALAHLISDTLVERPSSSEEHKWCRCLRPGAGAMGNGHSYWET